MQRFYSASDTNRTVACILTAQKLHKLCYPNYLFSMNVIP